MKWTIAAAILASISGTFAFVSSTSSQKSIASLGRTSRVGPAFLKDTALPTRRELKSSVSTDVDYDIVKVDLADGRDYPIYIGANFDEKEGR